MTRKKIAVIFGTRPDTIKLAPVIQELQKHGQFVSLCLITTGQHREMLDDVLSVFSIAPTYDLNVMGLRQSLTTLAHTILEKLDYVLAMEQPDMVVVQGDTATTFTSALAAFHRKIPVVHVEAGLRTNDRMQPFPEESYRRLTTHLSDLHFTPTPSATKVLLGEGIPRSAILCSGNTVIDALLRTVDPAYEFASEPLRTVTAKKRRLVVVTAHRRENVGEPMLRICSALKQLSIMHPEVDFVFPVHLNPAIRETVFDMLKGTPNIALMEPLIYPDFINLIARSYAVITDSGGLQEEAPSLAKPVLVLRDVTERPEAVKYGAVKLIGTETKNIIAEAHRLLSSPKLYKSMAAAVNPYGDGHASERIVGTILRYFKFSRQRVTSFVPKR
ncbi:MAG: UDP-N-acetylglucosamine 2-epimerase (non-hydrolyzing) [Bacteroidetes bacterium]|nr:UDP-N-acetylglucosamine 2-epimerase (non-hydrolyzing) [Bacteroidota bacterium]